MKLCLDTRPLLSVETGIANYVYNLIKHMALADSSISIKCFFSSLRLKNTKYFKNFSNIRKYRYYIPNRPLNYIWSYANFPKIEWLVGNVDIVHSTNYYYIPHKPSSRHITTVHDINFLKFPEIAQKDIKSILLKRIRLFLENTTCIIVPSMAVKNDIIDYFDNIRPDNIKVIHHGSIEKSNEMPGPSIIDGEYLLTVGSFLPRKNFESLIDAFLVLSKTIHKNYKLVIAGALTEELKKKIAFYRQKNIYLLDYVSRETIINLFTYAKLFIFPSIDEGFGLPVLEAQTYGVPVIISDIPVFKEIAADSALYFKPKSIEDIAENISRCLFDQQIQDELSKRGYENIRRFSWEKSAMQHIEVYKGCLN